MYIESRFLIRLAAVLACSLLPYFPRAEAEQPSDARFEAAKQLDTALSAAAAIQDPQQQTALLQSAAAETLSKTTANVFVQDLLRPIAQTTTADQGGPEPTPTDWLARAKEWRAALAEARDILCFEPLVEAPLPDGFPQPTPVGEIRVEQYPKHRLARTDMKRKSDLAFWTLFNHIKQHDIAMTAPVEMTYSASADSSSPAEGAPEKSAMSFMYRNVEQGRLGADGAVEVVDIPAQLALSIGIRGDATRSRVADAKGRLEGWLKDHADEYEQAGPLRVMGFNSPFVADQRRFTEVQIPVRRKPATIDQGSR